MATERIALTWAEVIAEGFRAVTPWPLMDDDDKAVWAKHAKKYLGKTTADDITMTWDRFGQVVHTTGKALESHWRRSEGASASSPTKYEDREQRGVDARRFFSNPVVTGERKAEIVAEALADDYVAEQVAARITSDPDLFDRLEKARKRLDKKEKPDTPELSLHAAWHNWLNRLNGILLEGARLAERTEEEGAEGIVPQLALHAYQLITERQIDAELRALTESENAK